MRRWDATTTATAAFIAAATLFGIGIILLLLGVA